MVVCFGVVDQKSGCNALFYESSIVSFKTVEMGAGVYGLQEGPGYGSHFGERALFSRTSTYGNG